MRLQAKGLIIRFTSATAATELILRSPQISRINRRKTHQKLPAGTSRARRGPSCLEPNNLAAVKDFRDCPCPLAPKLSRKRRTAFSADFLQKREAQSKSFHRNRARREASFYSPADLAPDEGSKLRKTCVTKRHYFINKFGCCVKSLISTRATN